MKQKSFKHEDEKPINIERTDNNGWRLSCHQYVPLTPTEVFPFFADAHNLERITPPFLNFKILSGSHDPLLAGATLNYTLRLHHIPVFWRTVITEWNPPHHFVDTQQIGPFKRWHHLHQFKPTKHGTEMIDVVTFDLYCRRLTTTPILGWIHDDLTRIFDYRRMRVAEILGKA